MTKEKAEPADDGASASGVAETQEDEQDDPAKSDPATTAAKRDTALRKPAPPKPEVLSSSSQPPEEGLQVAMGMQVMMQNSSFDRISPDIQGRMVDLANEMDRRSFDFACKKLDHEKGTRNQVLWIVAGFAALMILIGTFFAAWMLYKGNIPEAKSLILTGIAIVGAMLGGAGIQSALKNLGK